MRFEGSDEVRGYADPGYADALIEFGSPRELSHSGGWIVVRQIPGFGWVDAMGCYPLFCCRDWGKLAVDLESMGADLVSLALVTDPFGNYNETYLHECFEDVVFPFKEHFVVDLHRPIDDIVSRHHRYYARKALKEVCVEHVSEPTASLDEWVTLYANLIDRHKLTGMKAFSRSSFAKQLNIRGAVMFRALHQNSVVGAQIWLVDGDVGYSHLTAVSDRGYALRVSYAIYWAAIEYFSNRLHWLDLGAGAGVKGGAKDGLSEFKGGWATDTKTAFFCGRIFDRQRYTEIMKERGISFSKYFPAYREGEFG